MLRLQYQQRILSINSLQTNYINLISQKNLSSFKRIINIVQLYSPYKLNPTDPFEPTNHVYFILFSIRYTGIITQYHFIY